MLEGVVSPSYAHPYIFTQMQEGLLPQSQLEKERESVCMYYRQGNDDEYPSMHVLCYTEVRQLWTLSCSNTKHVAPMPFVRATDETVFDLGLSHRYLLQRERSHQDDTVTLTTNNPTLPLL